MAPRLARDLRVSAVPVLVPTLEDKIAQLRVLSAADILALDVIVSDVLERRLAHIEQSDLWRQG